MKHSKHKSVNRYHADQDGAWGTDALEARRELIRRHYDENAQKRIAYIKRNAYFYDLIGGVFGYLIGSGGRVLQIGCQNGNFLPVVEAEEGVCVDISAEMIRVNSEENPQYQYLWCPDEALPDLESFDDVIITNNGEATDIYESLIDLKKCIRPDTRICIYNYNRLWEPLVKLAETLGLKFRQTERN